ncbi:hypothetical protein [Staphylococcus carnosus]|uniref:Uncharacterized protein n=1 Tax=Staphylococcus carnosus (strain TM300) TaxID=396513 RepID=B9DNI0_STACT|nr:hypothetical protein [Staphylococcus carnosus]QPT04267.1 hypothetical protein I6G40_02025 [Staphylococcus carnosus]QRQ05022.1 hypothetical protein I6J34_12585 [Staphylococcus carnosus]UQA66992.1 hypothetical protein Sta3580_10680 [Staphylococcus carnosus]CAL28144.1 hypothetical protein SCA_1237 [Staphylococcus carnosus subsp. carnosus TM300]SUL90394.1 Uncharacterised protein [Staphylococcus carnosus]
MMKDEKNKIKDYEDYARKHADPKKMEEHHSKKEKGQHVMDEMHDELVKHGGPDKPE